MPRKDITEILKLMEKPLNIRNMGLVGHIDHGKTTLSDSLLSEAGLLSPDLAGEARALDYLEEEQMRGITMKSTNISLYYERSLGRPEPFLINLVDTPGHLDFSGKVTRALRLIDGVIVVVDAVEEVISQSETVIRQAIQEGVKPVLFINKVDRLIRELKLTDEQIRKKYIRIIKSFNTLIERHAEPPFDQEWKVAPADGNIAFGSALHKWGFTLRILENSDLKFKDIRERYKKETYSRESYADLAVYFPITNAIFEMVVEHLPNPIDAQRYRIGKIWEGDINSDIGKAMISCNPNGPLVICLSKVQSDKHGLIATGRVFSGKCSKKNDIFLLNENSYETIKRVAVFMGQRREQAEYVPVGNVVALEGLKQIKSGETIVDADFIDQMVPFESVKYVSTPVITASIEPEYLRDLDKMKTLVEDLLIEDPNLEFYINEENGEYLLSGMGPFHLEISANELEKRGVKVSMSAPRAVYRESCKNSSKDIQAKSPNGANSVIIVLQRLDDKSIAFFREIDYQTIKPFKRLKKVLSEKTGLIESEIEGFWRCHEQNVLIYQGDLEITDSIKKLITEIIEKIHLNGPLCGEKLTEIKIIIKSLVLEDIDEETAFSELSIMFYDAIKKGLIQASLILMEPIYNTIIQLPPEYIKSSVSILAKYSAKVIKIDHIKDYQAIIDVLMPVRNSIEFAEDIRSSTSGKAFWQNEFHSFQAVPSNEAKSIISDLKFIKGLSW